MKPDDRPATALWDALPEGEKPPVALTKREGVALAGYRDVLAALEEAHQAFLFLLDDGEGIDSHVIDKAVGVVDEALTTQRERLLEALKGDTALAEEMARDAAKIPDDVKERYT